MSPETSNQSYGNTLPAQEPKHDPSYNYLHYIREDIATALLLNGGGVMKAICGTDMPVNIKFIDALLARGEHRKKQVCVVCSDIYSRLSPC